MITYTSVNAYVKEKFQMKLYKLSLDGGFSCPNRDGKIDTRGCTFCDSFGAGSFAGRKVDPIIKQLEDQKKLISKKLPKGPVGFISYFQAFTGTYADTTYLRKVYMEALSDPEVKVLSIATRPDCLNEDVLMLLSEMNEIKPVWVELGLQSSKEESIRYIRRGYDNEVYKKAVSDLKRIGITHVITHIILFLPGENLDDMKRSVSFAIECGTNGIKLQLLHVLKNTDLCVDFEKGLFSLPNVEEYIDTVIDVLRDMPKDIVIHRLTGDGDKRNLVAPLWSTDKKRVLNTLNKKMREAD